ncbi:LysR family transcriptional regulator [Novosphingobium mangrovi (ex Huang et al. 2023)]|uniref:LysR family transcriptional regulator n=1 Tax=Novosphingobium mangrovi (ex Huang et al. 2023) TaxID=2976432 RepID=A0ABT2I1R0_9SPHN|nr:LysR family transcriptional regulator [Novosphingobium mangrovi (ex Huang et al. 2023)]MCT2398734.1 LysR family transcriptional regulator [Novosphingobium mangrovi (ex Huang et al. 2023)]
MTLEQLRIFICVAEREHMTRAAETLNLTQSAVSSAIAALESRHDVRLFHRVGRGIELTDTGRAFLAEARAVLGRAHTAELALADFAGLERGTLSLVASQTIASYWLPAVLARFSTLYPRITVQLGIANTEGAAAKVSDGSAELGFVEGLIDDPALARWQVGEDELALVGSSPVPADADPDWIRSVPWVLREPGSGTRSTFETALKAMGIAPETLHVAMTLPSNEAVRGAVEAGVGNSVLSTLVVDPSLRARTLHRIPLQLDPRPFYGLRHKERYRSKAADTLLDLLAAPA